MGADSGYHSATGTNHAAPQANGESLEARLLPNSTSIGLLTNTAHVF